MPDSAPPSHQTVLLPPAFRLVGICLACAFLLLPLMGLVSFIFWLLQPSPTSNWLSLLTSEVPMGLFFLAMSPRVWKHWRAKALARVDASETIQADPWQLIGAFAVRSHLPVILAIVYLLITLMFAFSATLAWRADQATAKAIATGSTFFAGKPAMFPPAAIKASCSLVLTGAVAVAAFLCWRVLRAVRRQGYRTCPKCLYNLNGLDDSSKCPECGTHYESAALARAWQAAGI